MHIILISCNLVELFVSKYGICIPEANMHPREVLTPHIALFKDRYDNKIVKHVFCHP